MADSLPGPCSLLLPPRASLQPDNAGARPDTGGWWAPAMIASDRGDNGCATPLVRWREGVAPRVYTVGGGEVYEGNGIAG